MKVITSNNQTARTFTARWRIKYKLAEKEPPHACNLLVPNANAGGIPVINKAGIVIKPPPPAIASINPATNATKNNNPIISTENSIYHLLTQATRYDLVMSEPADIKTAQAV